MDLSKAKFKILKTPEIPIVDADVIEFINYVPDEAHLKALGSGQYVLEEEGVFLADEEDDLDTYNEVLDKYDLTNHFEAEKAHEELASKGYVKLGDAIISNFLKRGYKEKEYSLALMINKKDLVVIAVSTNYKILNEYKKLIDNQATRFKLGLILNSHPERIITLTDFMRGVHEEIDTMEEELSVLNL